MSTSTTTTTSINPLAVAVQGLGFGAAQIALQGLLQYVVDEVKKAEFIGGNPLSRRTKRRLAPPNWIPVFPPNEDEELILLGIV